MTTSGFISILPPSVNDMYVYTTRGPRPSAKMKKFKAAASMEMLKGLDFNAEPLEKDIPYSLQLFFYMPSLTNKGWPGKAKTRFKRRDVTNLVKVLEDLVCEVHGIDDCQFVEVSLRKLHGPEYGKVGVRYCIARVEDDYE